MSTRCNIVVKDEQDTLWFYRHSDGYPEGAMPLLEKFMEYVKSGAIRDNVGQAAGWLILLGHQEYKGNTVTLPNRANGYDGWKVGAIEPTTEQHGDIEYLYTLDLTAKTIEVEHV